MRWVRKDFLFGKPGSPAAYQFRLGDTEGGKEDGREEQLL